MTVWYRVAVHNYSYLIIQINNYTELPTFLMYVILVYVYICHRVTRRCTSTDVTQYSHLDANCFLSIVRINYYRLFLLSVHHSGKAATEYCNANQIIV